METQDQKKFRNLIQLKFDAAKERNPRTSLRSFATRLGISSGALCDILSGNRPVSPKMKTRIASALDLSSEELQQIAWHPSIQGINFEELSLENYKLISDGIHFSILSLIETHNFQSDLEWISRRLNKPKRNVQAALKNLEHLKMICINDGKIELSCQSSQSPDEVPSQAIRKSHRQTLLEAEESLDRDSIDLRDFTSMTFSIDSNSIPEFKKLIRQFRKQALKLADKKDKNEVYKLGIQLFPQTQLPERKLK